MLPLAPNSFAARVRGSQLISEELLQRGLEAVGDQESDLANYLVREGLLTRFQARQLRAGSASLTVANYVVVDFIARGGSGIVLKACHKLMPGRYVALKTLETRNLHASPDAVARFRREIHIMSKLDHPNVVRALDVIHTRSHLYLVLEYVAGRDLGRLVRERGPLPVAEAVGYILQAARGLSYAHQMNIVHRDLKPTNMLLTEDRIVKIADMGLARFFSDNQDVELTLKGLAIGTPEYMAPEQAEDATGADARSDLYSLGASLFHLLTGTPSVDGSSYYHKLQQLLSAPPRPLAEARPDVPTGLAEVVDRLRARRPEDRPQTAEETIALLEPFAPEIVQPPPRPDPRQLADVVLRVLTGKESAETVCAQFGVTEEELTQLRARFIEGGRRAFDPEAASGSTEEAMHKLHAKIGAQQMEIEDLKRKLRGGANGHGSRLNGKH